MALQQAATFPFDRTIAMTPLLKLNDNWEKDFRIQVARAAGRVFPRVLNYVQRWGKLCEDERRIFKRPGPCSFQMRHFEASREFGLSTPLIYSQGVQPEDAQKFLVVGVTNDPVVDTETVRRFAAAQGVRYWELPESTSHSVLSIYARSTERPWWNCEVTLRLLDFINGRDISGRLISTPSKPLENAKCIWPYQYQK